MRENNSPWYPSYCDRLLERYNYGTHRAGTTTQAPTERVTTGWGWTKWGPWVDDACPDVCGRRCRIRYRSCAGEYNLVCKGRGRAYDLEDCPELTEEMMDEMAGDTAAANEIDDGLSMNNNGGGENGNGVDGDVFQVGKFIV